MTDSLGQDQSAVLASAAAGDEVAFGRIVAAHHAQMVRICHAIARDRSIAEDAVQSAWTIAWRKLDTIRDPQRLRPWLTTVAVNETRRLLRKRSRRLQVEIPTLPTDGPGGVDPATGVAYIDLQLAMERLVPDDRALLALRFVAGFDATELGAALGISASGTRTRIERLVKRLREELADD